MGEIAPHTQRTYTCTKNKNASQTAALATIDVRPRHKTNPRSTRFVSGKAGKNIDDDLEDIMLIRSLGGERLPTASHALSPNLTLFFFVIYEEGPRLFVVHFLHTSRRYTYLDMESTHGQPTSCRARPVNIDHHLENSMWIHGVGGERLPAVSYALWSTCNFAIGEGPSFFAVCFR